MLTVHPLGPHTDVLNLLLFSSWWQMVPCICDLSYGTPYIIINPKRSASDRSSVVAFEHLGVPIFKQWASLDLSSFSSFLIIIFDF
jgi:hypothetical protein